MKKIFTFVAAALMSVSMFATPASVPTVSDVAYAGYDVTKRVIVLYFDEEVCNDIVWAGSYNEWNTGTPAGMLHFEALDGFEGWYVLELDDASNPCQGKPAQLTKDGSFDWEYQAGDVDAWINMAQSGSQTATFEAGYPGEANCTWPTTGVYIYEVAYFKQHNTPCGVDTPKHNYFFTVYLPEFCDDIEKYADSVRVMGGFDDWSNGVYMQKIVDEDFNDCWVAEIKDVEEGTEFKLRFGTDKDWKVQVQQNGANMANETLGATESITLYYTGDSYGFAACPTGADYEIYLKVPAMCEDGIIPAIVGSATPGDWYAGTEMTWDEGKEAWYIKLENASGEYKFYDLNLGWDNEIQIWDADKEEWVGTPNLKLEDTYVIYIDYSSALYRWKNCAATTLKNITATPAATHCVMIDGRVYINHNGKLTNMLGF